MSHFCICPKCNQKFNRDIIQAVKVSARRYGHATCYPDNKDYVPLEEKKENNEDYQKLMDYIKKIYGEKANYALINKQIKNFTTEKQYSLSGILKSLVYFYEVKGNSVSGSNGGIGIVEYCYQDAYNYFYSLFVAQQANKDKVFTQEIKEISFNPPKMTFGTKHKFFDLEGVSDEE